MVDGPLRIRDGKTPLWVFQFYRNSDVGQRSFIRLEESYSVGKQTARKYKRSSWKRSLCWNAELTKNRRRHSTAVMQVHSLNKHRNMYIDHISVQSSIALMLTANCSIFSWSIYVHAWYILFFWELIAQDLSAHICPHLGQQSGSNSNALPMASLKCRPGCHQRWRLSVVSGLHLMCGTFVT